MNVEKVNNGRFLGALGFLGFLGFLAFTGTRHGEWTRFAWLSLPSLLSLGVFLPWDKAKVKVAVNPCRKGYLGALGFLGFLGFLGSTNPDMATLAVLAILAGISTQADGTPQKTRPPRREPSRSAL
ncbi:MAG: hypothetical protein FJ280_04970 [Planctomycetes bacterium]|nr:hypothetical protein [Planctomycetota bacterium]